MTIYRIDPNNPLPPVYGDGESALVIGDGDTVILGQGAAIAAYGRNGWGLFGGFGNNLLIDGSVHSEWATAIAAHGAVTIGATGRVYGGWTGLLLRNDSSLERPNILHNAGLISSGEDGFAAVVLQGASNIIVNSGEIRGAGGIWGDIDQPGGGTFTLYNSGLIRATAGVALEGALFGTNHIVNTGHIVGTMIFGHGNDFYDGRDGTWSTEGGGDIFLLEGDDVFYGGSSREFIHGDAGNDTLDGAGGNDRLLGRSGDDFLRGGSGNDVIWGESGIDVAVYSGSFADYTISKQADGNYSIVDNRTGLNDGSDVLKTVEYLQFADRTIALTATNSAPTSISLDATSIDVLSKPGALVGHLSGVDPDGDALGYHLVTNPGSHFRIHGDQLIVDKAFASTDTAFDIVVRASDPKGASLDMHFIIKVTANGVTVAPSDDASTPNPLSEARVLRGGRKADILAGGDGDDHLNGGLGKDKMTGDLGDDVFAFTTRLGKTNVDRVVDFRSAEDTIHLASKIFFRLDKGALSQDAFHIGSKAHDRSDRIIFNEQTGALSYDADGSGTKYAAVKFAQLKAKTLLQADDFFIV